MVVLKKHVKIGGVVVKFPYFNFLFFVCYLCLADCLINVSYADEKKNSPIFMIKKSAKSVWQRQQLIVTAELRIKDSFARLEAENFKQKGFSIIAYPLQRKESEDETILILKWAVFPYVSGTQKLYLPKIVLRPNRGRKQVLSTKAVEVLVKKLPIYISPIMPVGKISLENTRKNRKFVYTDDLLEWKLRVVGENVVSSTMPPISRQIVSTNALKIFPVKHTQSEVLKKNGVVNYRNYTVPFKINSNGFVELPKLEVQYFNPESGKLEKVILKQSLIFSLNKWLAWSLLLGLVLLLICLFNHSKKQINYYYNLLIIRLIKRKQAIGLFSKAQNYRQMRSAVNQIAMLEGWGANLPFTKFLEKWEQKFGKSTRLENKIKDFETYEFSSEGGD